MKHEKDRARLDADRKAKPKTRILIRPKADGRCVLAVGGTSATFYEDQRGMRIRIA